MDEAAESIGELSLEEQAALYDRLVAFQTAERHAALHHPVTGHRLSRRERRAMGWRGPLPPEVPTRDPVD